MEQERAHLGSQSRYNLCATRIYASQLRELYGYFPAQLADPIAAQNLLLHLFCRCRQIEKTSQTPAQDVICCTIDLASATSWSAPCGMLASASLPDRGTETNSQIQQAPVACQDQS